MKYSVVIPVFNSASMLEELNERLIQTLQNESNDFEIIYVDDDSTDRSWETLLRLKQKYKEVVKLVRLAKNYGQHSATLCGLKFATGTFIVTIDDDLQNAPEDIPRLIEKQQETQAELVYGIGKKQHSKFRKAASSAWKQSSKTFEKGLGEGSSFRLFGSELKDKMIPHQQSIIFLDELLFWYTGNIQFVEVPHYPRKDGKSGYTPLKLLKFIIKLTFNYSTVPLKLMTIMGVVLSIGSFLLGLWFVVRKLFFNVSVPGFTATIVTILFSTSIILIGIGIIGKYLSNIMKLLNNRPSFSIQETKL